MKISFIIGGAWEVNTLKGLNKTDYLATDSEFFYLIKALEKNKSFETAVTKARKKLKIPENGMHWTEYENLEFDAYTNPKTKADTKKFEQWLAKVTKQANKIKKQFKLHEDLIKQLPNIIICGSIFPVGASITDEPITSPIHSDSNPNAYGIIIKGKVSKAAVKKYIDDRWNFMKDYINDLPSQPKAYISQRDERIMELKDKGKLTFKDIADKIAFEFKIDNADGKINEDSVKIAYNRAKAKIKKAAESIR